MQVRQATIADARRIAQIHVEAWRIAYRGQMPDAVLDALDIDRRAAFWNRLLATQPQRAWVAESDNEIIGFCDFVPSRDPDSNPEEIGEIVAIYVEPESWRKGAGLALCRRALDEAHLRNYTATTLWVLSTNTPARNFYEAMGFRLDGATKIDHSLIGHELHEVRYKIPL